MLAVPLPPLPLASSRRVNLAAAGRDPARLDPAGLGGPLPWLSDPQDAADDGASSPETRRPLVSLGDAASDRFAALAAARDDQDSDEDDWAAGKARLLKKPTNLWSRLEAASASDGMDVGRAADAHVSTGKSGVSAVLEDPKFDDSHDADPMLDDDNDDVEDQAQVPVHRKHSERIAAQRNRVSKAKPTASVVVRGRKQGSAVIGV
nr:hypothetical protein HK105_006008 [Polyrhizophydium stewartii]